MNTPHMCVDPSPHVVARDLINTPDLGRISNDFATSAGLNKVQILKPFYARVRATTREKTARGVVRNLSSVLMSTLETVHPEPGPRLTQLGKSRSPIETGNYPLANRRIEANRFLVVLLHPMASSLILVERSVAR
jgi:hypothetical protein